MVHKLFDDILSYIFSLEEYIDNLKEKRIEVIGIIGIVISFLSSLVLAGNLEFGFWVGITNLATGVIYALLVIGILWTISKTTLLHPAQVFWFMFSVGIIDSLITFFTVFKFLIPQLFVFIVAITVLLKIYYLTKGISIAFNIPKPTSLIILASPYVLVLILILTSLVITYLSLYREFQELLITFY